MADDTRNTMQGVPSTHADYEERLRWLANSSETASEAGPRKDIVDVLLPLCREGAPSSSLRDEFAATPVDNLKETLRGQGITPPKDAGASQLADILLEEMTGDATPFLSMIAMGGRERVACARRLLDAGGTMRIPFAWVRTARDVAFPLFPLWELFAANGAFLNIMPAEVVELLRPLDEEAWQDCEREAGRFDDALTYMVRLADLRGIVPLLEAIELYTQATPDPLDPISLAMMLAPNSPVWGKVELREIDEETYIVSGDLLHEAERYTAGLRGPELDTTLLDQLGLGDLLDTADDEEEFASLDYIEDVLFDVLDGHLSRPARPLTDELLAGGEVWMQVMHTPEAQALVEQIDQLGYRSPEDGAFALDVACGLILSSRIWGEPEMVLDELARYGITPKKRDANSLCKLAEALQRVVPRWPLNGWSQRDL